MRKIAKKIEKIKKIKKILEMMKEKNIIKLELENGGDLIKIKMGRPPPYRKLKSSQKRKKKKLTPSILLS